MPSCDTVRLDGSGANDDYVFKTGELCKKGMEMRKLGRSLALLLVTSLFISLTGCNTIAGVGEDISGSARTVQHSL